jgi:hypothetical protein
MLTIINQTSQQRSYLSGSVTVAANSNTTVTIAQLYPTCRDSLLVFDCMMQNVYLSDGTNIYIGQDALTYLSEIAASLGGAVVGYAGAAAPSFQITIGGKDSNGNSQPARMNQFADLSTNFRNSYRNITGNSTVTVKSSGGTLHGIMVNNNSTGGTITIYDNTAGSGTVIAVLQVGTPSGGLLSSSGTPTSAFLGP